MNWNGAFPFDSHDMSVLYTREVARYEEQRQRDAQAAAANAALDISGLRTFDADVKYKAANIRTGTIPIKNLDLGLGLDHLLLTLKPIAFDIAGGRLIGDVSINARKTRCRVVHREEMQWRSVTSPCRRIRRNAD